jgi:ParB family chromosome partitioning protein
MSAEQSAAKPAVVTKISADNISPNPHNPRRLFDPEPLKILQESIAKLGVLVPITVYPKLKDATDPELDKFVLLDGERRWRCVLALRQDTIPAIIVAEPTDVRNMLTMFDIHNLRLGWQLMPTALKLEVLMEELNETNERKLAALTKLTVAQVRRCKILLTYPRRFQNMMLAPPDKRLKADFFIELQRIRGPALDKKFPPWTKRGDSKCIELILDKYVEGTIKAVTDFRIIAEIYRGSLRTRQLKRFCVELEKFLSDRERGIGDINVPGATYEIEYKEVLRSAKRLLTQVRRLEPDVISANKSVVRTLRTLSNAIQEKLEKALVERS